jgi:hypothetical protein
MGNLLSKSLDKTILEEELKFDKINRDKYAPFFEITPPKQFTVLVTSIRAGCTIEKKIARSDRTFRFYHKEEISIDLHDSVSNLAALCSREFYSEGNFKFVSSIDKRVKPEIIHQISKIARSNPQIVEFCSLQLSMRSFWNLVIAFRMCETVQFNWWKIIFDKEVDIGDGLTDLKIRYMTFSTGSTSMLLKNDSVLDTFVYIVKTMGKYMSMKKSLQFINFDGIGEISDRKELVKIAINAGFKKDQICI